MFFALPFAFGQALGGEGGRGVVEDDSDSDFSD